MNSYTTAEIEYSKIEVLKQIWSANDKFSYETNSRPFWGICYILSGKIIYCGKGSTFSACAGNAIILKKGAYYRAEFPLETHCILVNFSSGGDFAEDEKEDIIIIDANADIKNDFADIFDYSMFESRKCMVKSVFYRILDKISANEKGNALSAKIKKILNADIDFTLSETDIAKQCSVSISTAQRSFLKAYGKTISAYKSELRIARAKSLLLMGLYSVEQIADMLNFCDGAYFSRCFKRTVGMSPKQFVKQSHAM